MSPWSVIALAILALTGCCRTPPGAITKSFVFDAQLQFQSGNRQAALVCIQKAMAASRDDILDRASACELYDDAGLYYFATDDIEESRFCQSIAVLLSRSPQTPTVLQEFCLANLAKIYGRLGKKPGIYALFARTCRSCCVSTPFGMISTSSISACARHVPTRRDSTVAIRCAVVRLRRPPWPAGSRPLELPPCVQVG